MRVLEVRRHSLTKKGPERGKGSHLSAQGVRLAREIGGNVGPSELVLTSPVPRTLETALAMGYAVDNILDVLAEMPQAMLDEVGHYERWSWPEPFKVFADIMATGGATAQMGQKLRETWQKALDSVSENGKVLVISHGRLLEPGLIACLPDADYATWGKPFQHMEGFQLDYAEGVFSGLKFQRL
jgi:broad specificity phosphatase PhoE